ncbi:hypothetical protein HDU92_005489 [Lobulomyces angularis]|nr:hypothetical protein HDU92_005489 [Lobulomyces angularis]
MQFQKDFGYVLLTTMGYSVQAFIEGIQVSSKRKQLGLKYPDMGTGRHAAKLTEKEWDEFNSYQRVHHNYLEQLNLITITTLVAGFFQPRITAGLGAVYIFGRYLYGRGYRKHGPAGRTVGSFKDIAGIGIIGIAFYSVAKNVIKAF